MERALAEALSLLPRADRLTAVINDPQRHTDSLSVLQALHRLLPGTTLRLMIACGTHTFVPDAQAAFERPLRAHLPVEEVLWHDCRKGLISIGGLWHGQPGLLQDEPLLVIGSVEPHYFAGFTGAHKTCTIGCASAEDIEANHAAALDPLSRLCAMEGNPVFDGVSAMLSALERSRGPLAAVNVVQTGEEILACSGGGVMDSVRRLLPAATEVFTRRIPEPADALIIEVTGPLGESFYQADKAIKNNEWAVRDGGCLVLLAPCPQGIGQDHFVRLLREAPDYASAARRVQEQGYRLGDHKAVKLRYLTDGACRGVRVLAVSEGLTDEHCRTLGFQKAASLEQAIQTAGADLARDRVYFLKDAANLVVTVGGKSVGSGQ